MSDIDPEKRALVKTSSFESADRNQKEERKPKFARITGEEVGVRLASMVETDSNKIARREKQIEYGKNTIGYENYIRSIPKLDFF